MGEGGCEAEGKRRNLQGQGRWTPWPVDVFLEVGPVFDIEPRTDVNYKVAIGARFWF